MNEGTLFQWAIGVLGTVSISVTGWIIMQIGSLKKDHEQHRLHVAENYSRKSEVQDTLKEIKEFIRSEFTRIYDKLDGKADKP